MVEQIIKKNISIKINLFDDKILELSKFEKTISISVLQYNHLKLHGIVLLFFLD
jgi:hypothetical protein